MSVSNEHKTGGSGLGITKQELKICCAFVRVCDLNAIC